MTRKLVAVECNPDELLMSVLGIPQDGIAHQNSIGEVCKYLMKGNTRITIVDEDPQGTHPRIMREFVEMERKHDIAFLYHPGKHKFLFVLCPRLEEWICSRCNESGISPTDFNLPSNPVHLKKGITYNLEKVESLLASLLQIGDAGMMYLKSHLTDSDLKPPIAFS
jgi:hypothetical protein